MVKMKTKEIVLVGVAAALFLLSGLIILSGVLSGTTPSTLTTTAILTTTETIYEHTQELDKLKVEDLNTQVVSEFSRILNDMKWEGYDVFEAYSVFLHAVYLWKQNEYEEARRLFYEAVDLLKEAKLLPTVENKKGIWNLTESNIHHLRDVPTEYDFLPIGTVFVESEKGYLAYPSNDLKWKLSCFIYVAYGTTEDEKHVFAFQGRLPFTGEGSHTPLIFLDGRWIKPFPAFFSPLYIDREHKFSEYLTVYNYDASRTFIQRVSYNIDGREWIFEIKPLEGHLPYFKIVGKAKSATFWMGKWPGPYIIHGVTFNRPDLDIWGGFWDMGDMEATLKLENGSTYVFRGFFLWDRASHRTHFLDTARYTAGAPLSFTCMGLYSEDLIIMVAYSDNPSPLDVGVSFQCQGLISFTRKNLSFPFTELHISDNGGLQPTEFHLYATFEAGYVNLTGQVFMFWPHKWKVGKGVWWNPDGGRTWGRAFVEWSGEVKLWDDKNTVQMISIGEYTRCSESVTSAENGECGCYDNEWLPLP